ncbi:MAG: hypothetical protein LH470_09645 [Lysobacter sp.]|nr:hypothetical protein [Lysobacter sp.]
MADMPAPMTPQDVAARRRGVLRTAWALAAIALLIFVVFIASGVLGK